MGEILKRTSVPLSYSWLYREGAPRMLMQMLNIYGTIEVPGDGNNPVILAWADTLGIKDYKHDSIAWCGLAMAIVAHRAGKEVPKGALWAKSWGSFGRPAKIPMLGDVMVFARKGGGAHVTMYIGEDEKTYFCMGGNQGNRVSIVRIQRARQLVTRRPIYREQPINVRRVFLEGKGEISTNEQ